MAAAPLTTKWVHHLEKPAGSYWTFDPTSQSHSLSCLAFRALSFGVFPPPSFFPLQGGSGETKGQ